MQRILILLVLTYFPFCLTAQDEEADIRQTLENYLEGGTNGDVERFKSAFVPDAIQKSIGKTGRPIGMSVEKLATKIKPGTVMKRETGIVSISFVDVAATAITETIYTKSKIVDLLNLLKVEGEWKIVSRVYTRVAIDTDVQGNSSTLSPQAIIANDLKQAPKPKPSKKKGVSWDDEW